MELKVLEKKDKRYIFTAYENDKAKEPAACVFKKFPPPGKSYFKNIKAKKTDKGEVDIETGDGLDFQYNSFANDCIEKFENLLYEGKNIETVSDFLTVIPETAAFYILIDCYTYAAKEERFTAGE